MPQTRPLLIGQILRILEPKITGALGQFGIALLQFASLFAPYGCWQCDDMLANVCKHHVTRFPHELARLAQDLAGGIVVTLPSERDLRSPETGAMLEKYLKGREGVATEDRWKMLRLIENLTMGRNAVGYLTESVHGAGSPQAQRVQIARQMQLDYKKRLAKNLAGIGEDETEAPTEDSKYFQRVFKTGE